MDDREELLSTAYNWYVDVCDNDQVMRHAMCKTDFEDTIFNDEEQVSQYLTDSDMERWREIMND